MKAGWFVNLKIRSTLHWQLLEAVTATTFTLYKAGLLMSTIYNLVFATTSTVTNLPGRSDSS